MTLVLSGDSPSFSGTFQGGTLTLGTAQNTTSGTAIDFTGIPSWAKRITVMFNGVSVQASQPRVQLGSGSVATTGYSGAAGTAASNSAFSNGFDVPSTFANSGNNFNGHMVFTLLGSNTWVCGIAMGSSGVSNLYISGGGAVTLSGALDRVRLTTVNGTDTFDAGSVNILYEG